MLDISPILLVGSALVFLLVLARLNSCLYKPLMKHMDDRDNQIKTDLANAKSNATEVDDMLHQANDIIAQAKKEANSIREKARLQATDVADAKIAEAKSKMDEKYNSFLISLAEEKDTLEKSLIANIPTFKDGLKAKLNSI